MYLTEEQRYVVVKIDLYLKVFDGISQRLDIYLVNSIDINDWVENASGNNVVLRHHLSLMC